MTASGSRAKRVDQRSRGRDTGRSLSRTSSTIWIEALQQPRKDLARCRADASGSLLSKPLVRYRERRSPSAASRHGKVEGRRDERTLG